LALHLYRNVMESGSVPAGWTPVKGGTIKYPVSNRAVLRHLRQFFHAENCLFAQKHLRDRNVREVMSRGVQLADLFDALPPEQAHRELQRELAAMRSLCLKLVEARQLVA
jgi:hypothetical protein